MKIYYPPYYKDFGCIADKCRHSCCVGWEIYVDEDTRRAYDGLPEGEREEILSRLDDDGCIALCDGRRCPFLRSDGLCRIIADHGEAYTSRICREHPRFYHRVGERVECGIGLSCEEAARVVLSSDGYDSFMCREGEAEVASETEYDALSHREYIFSALKAESFEAAITAITEKYSLSDVDFSAGYWNGILSELELLDEAHRDIITLRGVSGKFPLGVRERFFAYLIFRHLSVASGYENLRARLCFCLLLLKIFEGNIASLTDFESVSEVARIISEEIEYSEDNTAALIFEMECLI